MKLILETMLGPVIVGVLFYFCLTWVRYNVIIPFAQSKTYVLGVQTKEMRDILEEYNKEAGIDVFFRTKYSKRAIRIFEGYVGQETDTTVGLAVYNLFSCDIFIEPDLDREILKLVLLHEIMHCYFIDHVLDMEDLMHPYSINASSESISHYLGVLRGYRE